MNPEEIRARLQEIRDEAEALRAEPTSESIATLQALVAERRDLEKQLEAHDLADQATADVPDAEADTGADAEQATGGDPEDTADAATDAEGDTTTEEDSDDATGAAESDEGDETAAEADTDTSEGNADTADTPSDAEVGEAIAASQPRDHATGTGNGNGFRPRLVASSRIENVDAGNKLTAGDVARIAASAASIRATRRESTNFAGIRRYEPGMEALGPRNSAIKNTELMNAGGQMLPLTAAACFCGPDEAVKQIAACGVDGRPVASLFRSTPVTGRFNYVKPLPLADVESGVSTWTCADQEAIDPEDTGTHKPCVDLDCQTEVNVEPYMLPTCGRLTTFQQLSHPELVDDFIRKLTIAHDRNAERELLDQIRAASHVYTITGVQGLLSTLVHHVAQLWDVNAFGNRIENDGYKLLLPIGTIEKIVADQQLRGAQQGLRRDAVIAQLQDIGISEIVEIHEPGNDYTALYADPTAALPAVDTPTPWDPDANSVVTIPFYLLEPDAFRHGASDIVEASFIRDANLTKQNAVEWFLEGAEFLEKTNCQPSYVLEITACPTGEASQMVAGPTCGAPA